LSRDLIYFSPIPWRGLYQRPQHTARALAAGRRVLFVEPRTLHLPPPPPDEENLAWLALPVLPVNARRPVHRLLARLASHFALARDGFTRRQGILLKQKLNALGMRDPLLLFGHPDFADLLDLCPDCPVVYDHMDDVLAFSRPGADLRRRLGRLAREAVVLSASAGKLAEQLVALGGKEPLRVGNGVELEHFLRGEQPTPEPAELAELPHPRAIYVGSVAEWFDFDLLFAVARALPDWSFPVVGPLRPALESRRAQAPSNVRFFGARPYDEVPAWLHHADAALIPFLSTTLTAGVDPVKLHEYLAAELPVVATPFSEELRAMADDAALSLAAEADPFAGALARVHREAPTGEQLRNLAAGRSWRQVLEPLVSAVDSL
jgi:UDP-galactopyranose mutase